MAGKKRSERIRSFINTSKGRVYVNDDGTCATCGKHVPVFVSAQKAMARIKRIVR